MNSWGADNMQLKMFGHFNELTKQPEINEQKQDICEQKPVKNETGKLSLEQLKAICRHADKYPHNPCFEGCKNRPDRNIEVFEKRKEKPYCIYCTTTENVSYLESEKANVCASCKEVYCS